jgi:Arc/MetJ-type ribon-helix-helix transcriptional regulator
MGATVQARLDDETQAALESLARRLGISESEVVREGIRLLREKHMPRRRKRVIGVGLSDSGIPDLSTNPKHMEGFGS